MLEVCGDELSLSFMLHTGCTHFFHARTHTHAHTRTHTQWFQCTVLHDIIILNMGLRIHLFHRFAILMLVINEYDTVGSIHMVSVGLNPVLNRLHQCNIHQQ